MVAKIVEKWKNLCGVNLIFYLLYKTEVILASLYVDDKEELPETEQTKVDLGNGQMKRIKTIGDKWVCSNKVNFNNNSQPHYVLVTPEEK